jgi:hypothetical protein
MLKIFSTSNKLLVGFMFASLIVSPIPPSLSTTKTSFSGSLSRKP